MLRALVIVMASLVSVSILGGCDEAETPTVDSFPSRTPVATDFSRTLSPITETPGATTLDSTNPDAAPAVMHAESLETLVSWYPHIVVGKIDALVEVLVSESVVDGQTFESSPISVYSVSVQQVIASGSTLFSVV